MELKLQLGIFMLFIQVSLAVWQRVTVFKGETLNLSCPREADKINVDWRNPDGYIMFFNRDKGEALRDKRYSIVKLSKSEFTISISSVTFKDGGNYTCSQYDLHTTEKKVEVTVLGRPKMTVTKHAGKFVVKCTAEGTHYPPQISWKLNHGPEFLKDAHSQSLLEDKKYISTDILHLFSETRVTVKCLLRHPALHSKTQMNFVKIGRDSTKSTTMTSPPTSQPQGSTEVLRTRHGRTTASLTTRDVHGPSSESSVKLSTVPSNQLFSSNEPSEASRTSLLSDSTRTRNESISNATSTTGWTSVSETTDETTFNNRTEGNRTVSSNDQEMWIANKGSSSLLVFLVTCLIFALLVVVIFFAIKLRRAHITWKKENEDSDPSEESSKSKSSQEEKNSQGQRRRGLFNTAFTQYVVEEPTVITSVINTGAMTVTGRTNKEQTSQPQTQAQTSARHDIKETEL